MPPFAAAFDPQAFPESRFVLNCRGRTLDCRPGNATMEGAHVMGILNATPDSFSDGGAHLAVDDAVARAAEMLSEGATILDVGGESTRPGADPVDVDTECERVVPVLEALHHRFPRAILSIDTYKPEVAHAALDAGAHIVNDVTGLRLHPETASIAAEVGAPLIAMHSVNAPGALTAPADYEDVTDAVTEGLQTAIRTATDAGVAHVVTDPGFGFGKSVTENLRLVNTIDRILALDRPVLIGVSRKSTIGAVLGTDKAPVGVRDRLYGSLGATAVAVLRGTTIVRTHDVAPTVEMLRVLNATVHA